MQLIEPPNFLEDLQNKKIIGAITNTYQLVRIRSGRSYYIEYSPYKIILTENFFFGDHLNEPNVVMGGLDGRLLETEDKISTFRAYINNGNIIKSVEESNFGKIDLKFDYKRIKKVTLNKEINAPGFSKEILEGWDKCFFTSIEFNMSLFDDFIFIFERRLLQSVNQLLNKTTLSKVIISE
jgi:hypothetical protein